METAGTGRVLNRESDSSDAVFSILAESEDLIAVDKPEGFPSIADRTGSIRNLHAMLQARLGMELFIVHRLDRLTSGVIVFAKNRDSHRFLCAVFQSGLARKTYHAIVLGSPSGDSGLIDKPLRRFGSGRVWVDEGGGKPSLTNYRVLSRGEGFSSLEVHPSTGRQQQIRAHLAFIGHAVAGDPVYGDKAVQSGWSRLMLHSSSLEIREGEKTLLEFHSPLPQSFLAALDSRVERHGNGGVAHESC